MAFFEFDFVGRRSLVRGDDFRAAWNWSQVLTPGAASQPVDLTGWSGVAGFYLPGADTPFVTVPVTVSATGNVSFTVGKAVTATFARGEVVFSLSLTDGLGTVHTLVRGKVRVL